MWENMAEQGGPLMTIWRMHIACWITKATDTHTHNMQYLMLFCRNNGCTKAPKYYVKGSIHPKLNCAVKLCKKPHEKLNWMFSGTAQVYLQVFQFFFVSSLCLLVRVTMVDKNKALGCCLLATSAIMLSGKKKRQRKMWSKKWYMRRNISCDAHLLNELLETDVPWDDVIVVSAGKLRKLWDSLSEPRSSVCERRLERTFLRPALLSVKTAQFTQNVG